MYAVTSVLELGMMSDTNDIQYLVAWVMIEWSEGNEI